MKTKLLLLMAILLLGLLPGRAQSEITIDGLTYEIKNGEATLVWGPVWRDDESGEEFDPVSKVVIPEKVVGCDVTTIYFNPYCDTLVIPKTVKTIDVQESFNGKRNINFDYYGDDRWAAKFIESKVENPDSKFRVRDLFYATVMVETWKNGAAHSWLKVPKGSESSYDNRLPGNGYSYPIMAYSEEMEDQGVIYRVKWSDKTAIIAGYTSDFPTGTNVSYTIPQGFTDASGNYFTVVGIDCPPEAGTLIFPADPSHSMKFLRNLPESLTKLIISEGLQNLYIDFYYTQDHDKLETFVCESGLRLGYASEINAEKIYYYGTYEDFDLIGDGAICADILYVPSSEVTKFQSDFVDMEVGPLPDGYTNIESNWTWGLEYDENWSTETAKVTGFYGNLPENIVIPVEYNGLAVIGIDAGSFENCTAIKGISIPVQCTTIGDEAFKNCTGLQSVKLYGKFPEDLYEVNIGKSSFEGCTSLSSFDGQNRVAFLGKRAFYGTTSLISFSLHLGDVIPEEAFVNSGIKELIKDPLSTGLEITEIGYHAFYGAKIERVSIENSDSDESRLTLGEGAFAYSTLREFEYNGPKFTIGKQAFQNSSLSKFTVSEPILDIGDEAFSFCGYLKTINLWPKNTFSPTNLGTKLFNYCTSLETITLPFLAIFNKANVLGHWLNSLTQVTMPEYWNTNPAVPDNTFVGDGLPTNYTIVSYSPVPFNGLAFNTNTYQNATVKVPQGQISTYRNTEGWRNFVNLSEITEEEFYKVVINDVEYTLNKTNKTATVTGYKEQVQYIYAYYVPQYDSQGNIESYEYVEEPVYNTHEAITLESSIEWNGNTYQVKEIANRAFAGCNILKKVTIPSNYTKIGEHAFLNSSLEEVVLNCRLDDMAGLWTAEKTDEYTSTTAPFAFCNLKKATVGTNTIDLPEYLFFCAYRLKEVSLPEGLKSIGQGAFGSSGIETLPLPSTLESIYDQAFAFSPLKNIELPENISHIGQECFKVTPLEEITIPGSVDFTEGNTSSCSETMNYVFNGANNLRKVVFAENPTVTSVEGFNGKTNLKEVVLPSTVKRIEDCAFFGCEALVSVTLPEGLETIGERAFAACSSLEEIHFPSTLKTIEQWAFLSTRLQSLCLPESLEDVGSKAFEIRLDDPTKSNYDFVLTYATTPPERNGKLVFHSADMAIPPLYVLVGCKAAYEEAWGDEFTDIREFPGTELVVYGEEKTSPRGATVEVPVELFNITEAAGVMFDVTLPEGVSLVKTTSGKYDVTLSGRTTDHQLIVTDLPNGDYRIIVVSLSSQPITGNDGTLLKMGLDVSTTAQSGDFEIVFHDTEVVTQSGTSLSSVLAADGSMPFTVLPLLVGDIDGNNRIQLLDVLTLLAHINNIQPIDFTTVNKQVADVVADDVINLLDALQLIYILSKQTTGTNAPSAPADGMVTVAPGEGGLDVSVSAEPFTALTMDVTLPSGFCVDGVTLDSSRCTDHSVRLTDLGGGRYRVIVFSTGLSPVQGESGRLMHISTSVTPTDVSIGDIEIGTCDLRQLSLSPVEGYTTGMGRLTGGLSVGSDGSSLVVTSDRNAVLSVVGTDGRLVRNLEVGPGTSRHGGFAPGVYVVNGARVIIR